MTNCLFAAGVKALTARLEVRYLHPVFIDNTVHLMARITKSKASLQLVEAELSQDGQTKARAIGSFINR